LNTKKKKTMEALGVPCVLSAATVTAVLKSARSCVVIMEYADLSRKSGPALSTFLFQIEPTLQKKHQLLPAYNEQGAVFADKVVT
jgi:hypothetical protein